MTRWTYVVTGRHGWSTTLIPETGPGYPRRGMRSGWSREYPGLVPEQDTPSPLLYVGGVTNQEGSQLLDSAQRTRWGLLSRKQKTVVKKGIPAPCPTTLLLSRKDGKGKGKERWTRSSLSFLIPKRTNNFYSQFYPRTFLTIYIYICKIKLNFVSTLITCRKQ